MSFFFLAASAPLTWSPAACDFYVYFPPTASRVKVALSTFVGMGFGSGVVYLLGVGLASGMMANTEWADAYEVSAGALITKALSPLGSFGSFCAVIIGLGLISNNIPGTYSSALSAQLLGRPFRKIPRAVWSIISVVIYTICACVGRDHLSEIFSNFLALMGYWVIMFVVIMAEEEFIFRRRPGHWYKWTDWDKPSKLPVGLAALTAFCIGWVGAVLCMYQVYFTGPIAKLVGDGIDMGFPVSASWAAVLFPPLRWLELKYIGR